MKKFFFITTFTLVLLAALWLRLGGIGYGLPYTFQPDETRIILDTLSMAHRKSLLPVRPDYALLYRYLLLFFYGLFFLIGKLLGHFRDSLDFAFQFMVNPTAIYLLSRLVSVIFGMATGLMAFFLGRRYFNRMVGWVAMVFVLFEYQLLQHAQWAFFSIVFCFMSLVVFYSCFRLLQDDSNRSFFLLGLSAGLSISVQNHAIFLLPSVLAALLYQLRQKKGMYPWGVFFRKWLIFLVSLFVFSLLGNFYWFFIFPEALAKTQELMGVTRVGFASQAPYAYNIFSMSGWFIREVIRQDTLLGVVLIGTLFYSLWKHTEKDIIFLVYIVVNLWVFSDWGFRWLHFILGVMPIMCLFGARFLVEVLRFDKGREALALGLACFLVFQPAYDSFRLNERKEQPDTRVLAKVWCEENIPKGSRVAIDGEIFSVPLQGEIPSFFRNPIAKEYYETKVSLPLRDRYREYLKDKVVYDIYEVMIASPRPIWPKDMPQAVIEKARRQAVYRNLYSRFNFTPLEDLKKKGIEYLIITSYSYDFFLLDTDPHREYFFSPFFKDRMGDSYRHARQYIDDGRHGLIFYLVKQGREFYQSLLDNTASGATLIKEFRPAGNNLGPVVKIYKIGS